MRSISLMRTAGFYLILLLVLQACGSDLDQVETPGNAPKEFLPDTTGQLPEERFETIRAEREAKGDTIAIAHETLQNVLTSSIPGFVLESDEASTFRTQNFTFSEAIKVFYNTDEHYIELVAGDYVANPDFIGVQLQRFNLAQDVTIQGVRDVKFPLKPVGQKDEFFAWASYNKAREQAYVNIGVDFRYVISISMTGVKALPEVDQVQSWLDFSKLPD